MRSRLTKRKKLKNKKHENMIITTKNDENQRKFED